MARTPSPWYRARTSSSYVMLHGRQRPLGPHPDGEPPPKKTDSGWKPPKAIRQAFHALMAEASESKADAVHRARNPAPAPPAVPAGPTVAEVYDKYLVWIEKSRSARTAAWYREHVQKFIDHLGRAGALMPASELRPHHVEDYCSGQNTWGDSHRRGKLWWYRSNRADPSARPVENLKVGRGYSQVCRSKSNRIACEPGLTTTPRNGVVDAAR